MKKVLVGFAVTLSMVVSFFLGFLPKAFAEGEASAVASMSQTAIVSPIAPKVNQGDLMVGGSLGFSYSTFSRLTFELNPTIEYFIVDRLSVGGTIGLALNEASNRYLVGPSATYYFWKDDRLTANVGAELRFGQQEHDYFDTGRRTDTSTSGRFRLGLNYFLTPEVSIGPLLTFDKEFENSASPAAFENSTLKVQFQIHL